MKDSLKERMKKAMKIEEEAVDQRFARAEQFFSRNENDPEEGKRQLQSEKHDKAVKKLKFLSKSITLTEEEAQFCKDTIINFAKEGEIVNFSEILRMGLVALKNDSKPNELIKKIIRSK